MTTFGIIIDLSVLSSLAGMALYVLRLPDTKRRDRFMSCLLAYLPFAVVLFKSKTITKKEDWFPWVLDFVAVLTVLAVAAMLAYKGEREDRTFASDRASKVPRVSPGRRKSRSR